MIHIGNFLFHYRNGLFPLFYVILFFNGPTAIQDSRLALIVGITIAAIGQGLRAWTVGLDYIVRGGRNRRVYADHLVQGGLFAHCRNPLYVGNYLILMGVGVASNSLLFLVIALPFFLFAYSAIIAAEEAFLLGKFGEDFSDYCDRVNRVIPNFSGLGKTLEGMRFNWRRLISAEYGSAALWMAAIILVTAKNLWFVGQFNIRSAPTQSVYLAAAILTAAYGLARFLKKTGKLRTN